MYIDIWFKNGLNYKILNLFKSFLMIYFMMNGPQESFNDEIGSLFMKYVFSTMVWAQKFSHLQLYASWVLISFLDLI